MTGRWWGDRMFPLGWFVCAVGQDEVEGGQAGRLAEVAAIGGGCSKCPQSAFPCAPKSLSNARSTRPMQTSRSPFIWSALPHQHPPVVVVADRTIPEPAAIANDAQLPPLHIAPAKVAHVAESIAASYIVHTREDLAVATDEGHRREDAAALVDARQFSGKRLDPGASVRVGRGFDWNSLSWPGCCFLQNQPLAPLQPHPTCMVGDAVCTRQQGSPADGRTDQAQVQGQGRLEGRHGPADRAKVRAFRQAAIGVTAGARLAHATTTACRQSRPRGFGWSKRVCY